MATPNSSPPTQRQGNSGPLVRVIQAVLNNNGFNVGAVDGAFGPKTTQAVMNFQRSRGLSADGVVGPKTWAALSAVSGGTGPGPTTNGPHLRASLQHQPTGFGSTTGTITVGGHTYPFNSGSRTLLSVPQGVYRVTKHRNSRSDAGFVRDGVGFSFRIEDSRRPLGNDTMEDQRDPDKTRTLLRIHPDGGPTGTAGCIGLVGNAATLRQFRDSMNAEIDRQGGSCTLTVL